MEHFWSQKYIQLQLISKLESIYKNKHHMHAKARAEEKSASFRENRIGKYGEKDQLSFSSFLIQGFGVHHQVFGDYSYFIHCFTSLIQLAFTIYLLSHMKILHPCLIFCPTKRWQKTIM